MQTFEKNQQFDPFVVLSIDRNSSIKDIKKQYLKLVKQLHPDRYRNKGQRAFEEAQQHMMTITKAYQILTDPNERSKYDQSQISTFNDMRSSFQQFDRHNTPQNSKIPTKGKFGQSELKDFNSMFEQQRRRDPNDKGYEDELDMAPRMSFNDAKQGYQSTNVSENPNLSKLKGKNFDPKRFNELFEQTSSTKSSELIEKPVENPLGFSLMNSTSFTDVSVYDGNMVLGSDYEDYSSYDTGGIMYTDYKKGYTQSSLINQCGPYEDDGMPLERKMQMRENEMFNQESMLSKSEWKRQAEHKFEIEKQKHIEHEVEQQKKIVMKYHDQYQDYLPSSSDSQYVVQPQQLQQLQQPQQSQQSHHPIQQLPSQMHGGYSKQNQQIPNQQLQHTSPKYLPQQIPHQQIPHQLPHQHIQQMPQHLPNRTQYTQHPNNQSQYPHPKQYHSSQQFAQPMQVIQPLQPMQQFTQPIQQVIQQPLQPLQQPMQQMPHALKRQTSPPQNSFNLPQNSRHFEADDSGYNTRFMDDTRYADDSGSSDRRSGRSYNDFMMDRMHNIH